MNHVFWIRVKGKTYKQVLSNNDNLLRPYLDATFLLLLAYRMGILSH